MRQLTPYEREKLLADLKHYAAAWGPRILQLKLQYDRCRHTEDAANTVMVPEGFHAVAAGAKIHGLDVITPALESDAAILLPYVCFVAPAVDHPTTRYNFGQRGKESSGSDPDRDDDR